MNNYLKNLSDEICPNSNDHLFAPNKMKI